MVDPAAFVEKSSKPEWLSTFLLADAALVATLIVVDWLIGKKGRGTLRDKLADFWVRLQETSFEGITERQIAIVDSIFNNSLSSALSLFQ